MRAGERNDMASETDHLHFAQPGKVLTAVLKGDRATSGWCGNEYEPTYLDFWLLWRRQVGFD
jgi:hypothetical protein